MVWWILGGAAIIGLVLWLHVRECGEISVGLAFERNPVLSVIGSGALLYCLYECVELVVVGSWAVPTVALYKHCNDLNMAYLHDVERMTITPGEVADADANAANDCNQRLATLGQIGVKIMTHDHDR